jgi:hypothetical protein
MAPPKPEQQTVVEVFEMKFDIPAMLRDAEIELHGGDEGVRRLPDHVRTLTHLVEHERALNARLTATLREANHNLGLRNETLGIARRYARSLLAGMRAENERGQHLLKVALGEITCEECTLHLKTPDTAVPCDTVFAWDRTIRNSERHAGLLWPEEING